MRYVYSFVPALILGSLCSAQPQTFQGELSSDSPREFGHLTVELQPAAGGNSTVDRAYVSGDGRFQFRNIEPGSYLLTVRDREGSLIHQQYTSTQGYGGFTVRLAEERRARPISGLVSVQELRRTPSRAARKAFDQAAKKAEQGDAAGSLALLEHAVYLDPEYLQALNNLGSQYVRAGRHEDAVRCLRRAVALAPRMPMIHANLAQALLFVRDYAGAESSARTAIALNGSDLMTARAQLALGLALVGKGEYAGARHVMVTCTRSQDELVRRVAEGYLARLR